MPAGLDLSKEGGPAWVKNLLDLESPCFGEFRKTNQPTRNFSLSLE